MFRLKAFSIQQDWAAQRVGTDALVSGAATLPLSTESAEALMSVRNGYSRLYCRLSDTPRALTSRLGNWREFAAREAHGPTSKPHPFTTRLTLHHVPSWIVLESWRVAPPLSPLI